MRFLWPPDTTNIAVRVEETTLWFGPAPYLHGLHSSVDVLSWAAMNRVLRLSNAAGIEIHRAPWKYVCGVRAAGGRVREDRQLVGCLCWNVRVGEVPVYRSVCWAVSLEVFRMIVEHGK